MPSLLRRLIGPEPTTLPVTLGNQVVAVDFRRSAKARRMTLRVSGVTGQVTLTVPRRARLASAEGFVARQSDWIAARLASLPERLTFEPGSVIPLRGVGHRIVHATGSRARTRAEHNPGGDPVILVGGGGEAVAGRVRRFCVAEAGHDLRAAVARYTGALGITARRVAIRDTRSRWGSCSSTGTLSFSWRLILAPPFVLDYLAAHEVAHLEEMNHSDRFWTLLRRLCPATDEAELWLKRHGADLHRYGVSPREGQAAGRDASPMSRMRTRSATKAP